MFKRLIALSNTPHIPGFINPPYLEVEGNFDLSQKDRAKTYPKKPITQTTRRNHRSKLPPFLHKRRRSNLAANRPIPRQSSPAQNRHSSSSPAPDKSAK